MGVQHAVILSVAKDLYIPFAAVLYLLENRYRGVLTSPYSFLLPCHLDRSDEVA